MAVFQAPTTETGEARYKLLLNMVRELSRDVDPVRSVNRYAMAMRLIEMNQGLISISLRGVGPGQYKIMRFLHQEGVGHEGAADLFFAGEDARVHAGGLFGEIIASPRVVVYGDLHAENDPVIGSQIAPYRSLVAFPVYSGGEVFNWVCFVNVEPDHFTQDSVELRMLQANLMGSLSDVKRAHHSLQVATEYIERQIDEIANIQRGMLPPRLPKVPGLMVAATYATYDRAGGDFYDVFPLSELCEGGCEEDRRWAFIIADASGHGPSAAVVVAMLSTLLHSYPRKPKTPSDLMTHLNRYLMKKSINHTFVTAFLGIYDPETKDITYTCAGHPMPMVRRSCGTVETLPQMDGIPLGIFDHATYSDATVCLDQHQCLLMYTDGITEARPAAQDMFGEDRLGEALGACRGTPQETLDLIEERLRAHEAGRMQEDDQTMLALQAR